MSYTIQQAQDDLSGIVHGKTVNKITNINSTARRAANNLLAMIDPDETRKIAQITLYDGVTEYNAPTGLKGKKIIDFRPQVNRAQSDNLGNRLSKDFDMQEWGDWFTVMDDGGTKYLRVKAPLTPAASSVDPMDDDTSWTASGDASALTVDDLYSVSNGDSLKFTLAAAGASAILTNSAIVTSDLSDWESVASFFLWVYLPTATAITSVTLRFGTSATKYWEATGAIHQGSQRIGWNLFRFDWATATKTVAPNTPNSAAITYVRLAFAYGGTAAVIRVDKLFASLPKIWDVEYYSKFLFSDAGTWQETVTDTSTTINLDTASYNLFLYEFALAGLQQIQGKDAAADRTYFYKELHGDAQKQGLYKRYKTDNPSQAEKPTQTYYRNKGWRSRGNQRSTS